MRLNDPDFGQGHLVVLNPDGLHVPGHISGKPHILPKGKINIGKPINDVVEQICRPIQNYSYYSSERPNRQITQEFHPNSHHTRFVPEFGGNSIFLHL